MNRAVLMSINPKWCALIASGKKTVEVRKTKPKLDVPFKVYIYQTKPREKLLDVMKEGDTLYGEVYHGKPVFIKTTESIYPLHGTYGRWQKVIGEFICDQIETVLQCNSGWVQENACISKDAFFDYLGIPRNTHLGYDKKAYGWHISDIVIYDKPKELSEFVGLRKTKFGYEPNEIKRPPQSWRYVEEIE